MANVTDLEEFAAVNFDLIGDMDEFENVQLSEEVSQQVVEDINDIISEEQNAETGENSNSADEFEEATGFPRHASVNEDALDYYSGKKDKEATKTQTKWAVKVLKVKYYKLQ